MPDEGRRGGKPRGTVRREKKCSWHRSGLGAGLWAGARLEGGCSPARGRATERPQQPVAMGEPAERPGTERADGGRRRRTGEGAVGEVAPQGRVQARGLDRSARGRASAKEKSDRRGGGSTRLVSSRSRRRREAHLAPLALRPHMPPSRWRPGGRAQARVRKSELSKREGERGRGGERRQRARKEFSARRADGGEKIPETEEGQTK
jgi:hypothetical protein